MYTRLNNLFNLIIKGLFETTTISIAGVLFIYIFLGIDNDLVSNKILALSLTNYLCAYALNNYVLRESIVNDKNKFVIGLASVVISFLSATITSGEKIAIHVVIYFIMYLFVWYKSITSITEKKDLSSARNSFVAKIVFIICMIIFLNIFAEDSITLQKLKMFFIIYVGVALSYFATINLENAYNRKYTNSLNKMENIKIINMITTIIILIILLFTVTGFFGIWDKVMSSNIVMTIGNTLLKIIEIILYPIVLIIMKIAEKIYRRGNFSELDGLNTTEGIEGTEDFIREDLSPAAEAVLTTLFNIIKWTILILIIYLIIRQIIKAINRKALISNEEDDEEKEFILTPKDIRNKIKKSLNNIVINVKRIFSKPNSELPIIRRIYLETILILEEKGFKFSSYFTPNEYLSTLEDSKFKNANITYLTETYNDCRYGNKEPTEENIDNCIKIKKDIYELSKDK